MFRKAAWAGLSTAALGVALTLIFPAHMGPLPTGMRTPILAFELARTTAEVETMFGSPGGAGRAAWRQAMDRGNYADFAFMLAYGLFFVLLSHAFAQAGSRISSLSWRVAALPALADVLENLQLLAITGALGGDYAAPLAWLPVFTWLKWLGVAAVYASWIPGMTRRGALGKIGALLATLNALATLAALVTRGVAAELMGLFGALTAIAAVTLAFRASGAPKPADA